MITAHIPRKRFGQHFLTDSAVIRAIVEAIHPQPTDLMVEIGPGLAALTGPLLARLPHLHVVELDRDIVARLHAEYPPERLVVHACDALEYDFGSLGRPDKPLRVVGNLPYNISTPLLFHLSTFSDSISDMTFMLQKEVVERMVAKPGGDYGRLSVMLQYRFAMEQLFSVSPDAFRPPPKVESAIVRMVPLRQKNPAAQDESLFAKVVATAFTQRRKTLRNALSRLLSAEDLTQLGIDPGLRPEVLSVADYVRIANRLSAPGYQPEKNS